MDIEEAVTDLCSGQELTIGPMDDETNRAQANDLIAHFLFNLSEWQLLSRTTQYDYHINGVGLKTATWHSFRAVRK